MARIVITIPTWNEATVIERNLSALRDASARFFVEHEVAIEVADNGSTDATREIASRIEGVSIHVVEGRGKGIAIRRSWEKHAESADVLVFTDADLAADLSALPHLIRPIISGEADLVCGSRFVAGAVVERKIVREAASHLYRALQRVILGLPVQDAHCGFKAISSGTARRLCRTAARTAGCSTRNF